MALNHSTARADAVVDACTCTQYCANCPHSGRWHTHADDPCAVHTDTLIDVR